MKNTFTEFLQTQGLELKDYKNAPKLYAFMEGVESTLTHEALAENYLNELCQYYFKKPYKGTVRSTNRYTRANGKFTHRRAYKGYERDLTVLEISYDIKLSTDKLADTLRHELVHYYCFINGLDFKDGEEMFEHGLNYLNASSTRTGGNKDISDLVQSASVKDRRLYGLKGITLGKARTIAEDRYSHTLWQGGDVQSLDVYLQGERIGTIIRAVDRFGGTPEWTTSRLMSKNQFMKTRKGIIQRVVEIHMNASKIK